MSNTKLPEAVLEVNEEAIEMLEAGRETARFYILKDGRLTPFVARRQARRMRIDRSLATTGSLLRSR